MTRGKPNYYSQFEKRSDPIDANTSWERWQDFGFRASWRIYMTEKQGEPFEARDYQLCVENDVAPLLVKLREQLGPQNERWAYDPDYVYIYLRTNVDFAEFRLAVELPNEPPY